MYLTRHVLPFFVALALLPACRGVAKGPVNREVSGSEHPASSPARALDWTVGAWEGVRRGAADGEESPMVMQVTEILDGAGQTRELEIVHDNRVYRGFCVQVYDSALGVWSRQYVNDVRLKYAPLEGSLEGLLEEGRSVWRGTSPGRTRESRLVSERPSAHTWRRTMSVSEDGGTTWTPLWIDELERRQRAKE